MADDGEIRKYWFTAGAVGVGSAILSAAVAIGIGVYNHQPSGSAAAAPTTGSSSVAAAAAPSPRSGATSSKPATAPTGGPIVPAASSDALVAMVPSALKQKNYDCSAMYRTAVGFNIRVACSLDADNPVLSGLLIGSPSNPPLAYASITPTKEQWLANAVPPYPATTPRGENAYAAWDVDSWCILYYNAQTGLDLAVCGLHDTSDGMKLLDRIGL